MKCNCIQLVEQALSISGFPEARIEVGFSFPDGKEHIMLPYNYLPKGKKKRKTEIIAASFCPFCGEPAGLVPKE